MPGFNSELRRERESASRIFGTICCEEAETHPVLGPVCETVAETCYRPVTRMVAVAPMVAAPAPQAVAPAPQAAPTGQSAAPSAQG